MRALPSPRWAACPRASWSAWRYCAAARPSLAAPRRSPSTSSCAARWRVRPPASSWPWASAAAWPTASSPPAAAGAKGLLAGCCRSRSTATPCRWTKAPRARWRAARCNRTWSRAATASTNSSSRRAWPGAVPRASSRCGPACTTTRATAARAPCARTARSATTAKTTAPASPACAAKPSGAPGAASGRAAPPPCKASATPTAIARARALHGKRPSAARTANTAHRCATTGPWASICCRSAWTPPATAATTGRP